jgi:hypothetical protein
MKPRRAGLRSTWITFLNADKINSMKRTTSDPEHTSDARLNEDKNIIRHENSLVESGLAEAEAKTPTGHPAVEARQIESNSTEPRSAGEQDAAASMLPTNNTATASGAVPKKRASVARSAGIVSLAVMASRVLGLVREMVFAYFFGASKSFANDAYVIAFRIPNLLRDLFAEGALSSGLFRIPG